MKTKKMRPSIDQPVVAPLLEPTVIETPASFHKMPSRKLLIAGGTIVVLALLISGYSFYQYYKTQQLLLNPTHAAQQEVQSLVSKVGKLMILPEKEVPTVATVSDIKKLLSQPFFKNAQNGDKVLIFSKSKKAILYRPEENVLVEVSTINIVANNTIGSTPAVAGAQTQVVSPTVHPIKIVIYNGTSTVGLAKVAQKHLEDELKGQITVTATDNAQKRDYSKTQVIDLKGSFKTSTQQLANLLNGEVVTLPEGEIKPDADILIIVGS